LTNFQTYIPQPPLAAFVEQFWLYEGYKLPHTKERRLPDGSMEMVINLCEDKIQIYHQQNIEQFQNLSGSVLSGPHTEFFTIDTASLASVIGIHFRPGGAFPFFKLLANELLNLHVSLDTIWGKTAADLRNQLLETKATEAKFHILEKFLLTIAVWPQVLHPAVGFALNEFQSMPFTRTISDVAAQISLSNRHFIRVFREAVGMTPKQFCCVRRFQEALHQISKGQEIAWTELALTCGYFDQSHFNHDFRIFTGYNPSTYVMRRSEHHNHVPIYE